MPSDARSVPVSSSEPGGIWLVTWREENSSIARPLVPRLPPPYSSLCSLQPERGARGGKREPRRDGRQIRYSNC
eukprot:scaffold269524_cov35-Tisochrysis_lutea.AAC.1